MPQRAKSITGKAHTMRDLVRGAGVEASAAVILEGDRKPDMSGE